MFIYIKGRTGKLKGDYEPDEHAYNAPNDCGYHKVSYDFIIITEFFYTHKISFKSCLVIVSISTLGTGSLSNNILMAGVQSSSYCPDLTDQRKATKNPSAKVILTAINTNITLIAVLFYAAKLLCINKYLHDLYH